MSLTLQVNITEFNLMVTDLVWTRNGNVLLDQVDGITITNVGLDSPPGMSTLTLDSVATPVRHAGTYLVNATNPAGSGVSTFNVTVTGEYHRAVQSLNGNIYL